MPATPSTEPSDRQISNYRLYKQSQVLGFPTRSLLLGLGPEFGEDHDDCYVDDERAVVQRVQYLHALTERENLKEYSTDTEDEIGGNPEQDSAGHSHLDVGLSERGFFVLAILEDKLGGVLLAKPQEKRDVVSPVVPMPEGTHQECEQLPLYLALKSGSFIDTASQPFLHSHVPIRYFQAHMHCGLHYFRVAGFDQIEVLTPIFLFVVGYPRRVHSSLTELPGEVVLEPDCGHREEPEHCNLYEWPSGELGVLHGGKRENKHVDQVDQHQADRVGHILAHTFPGRRDDFILVLQTNEILVHTEGDICADDRSWYKLTETEVSDDGGNSADAVVLLLGRQLLRGGFAILQAIGEVRVFADVGHDDGGNVKSPAAVIYHHTVDVID